LASSNREFTNSPIHQLANVFGMSVELVLRMDEKTSPTVEMSLEALSIAVGKASEDLASVRSALDVARADIANHNMSMSRDVVKDAERVIDHLRLADEGLREVLKDIAER
jgi:hypothetical protein